MTPTSSRPRAVALVPARAGSERVSRKNVRPLAGHPLLAYTIAAARQSGCFARVVVSTDSTEIADVARSYGADVPELRPAELATATSPDVEWVRSSLAALERAGEAYDAFSILRPTSPFRTAETIRRAWDEFARLGDRIDSLRAVELCRQHPGKMWLIDGELMRPLLEQPSEGTPWHSSQYQALPRVYVQNSSLEIAWTRVVTELGEIAGARVAPFLTDELEGLTIDYPEDFDRAGRLVATGVARLPEVGALAIEIG
jgi:CMP-N,N'-diacetyllegionaminic acid synthase